MKEELRVRITSISLFVVLMVLSTHNAFAQGAIFTYQGRLTQSGNPASATYDMQFKLFDTPDVGTGTQQGATVTNPMVVVSNGVFSVPLNFGSAVFDGSARFLEIGVRPAGSPDPYAILSPRQAINSTPYAVRSATATAADTATNATQLGGLPASGFIQNTITPQGAASFNINGDGTAAGTLSGNAVNATSQYNVNGHRVLSAPGFFNLFAGVNAGIANTSGSQSAFFGDAAGMSNTDGHDNSFFGNSAGQNNISGALNSFFGSFAGYANTMGDSNVFVGTSAGANNSTEHDNTLIGTLAGFKNGTGDSNPATANFNTFVGSTAGLNNTIGGSNSFFGANAGKSNTTAFNNSFFGAGAGGANTLAGDNSFFGSRAGFLNTTGAENSFFGLDAGRTNTTEHDNTFIGSGAGFSNGTNDPGNNANFNTFVGRNAGFNNTSACCNSFFGYGAGQANMTGFFNSFFGLNAGQSNITERENTFIGHLAGSNNGTNDASNNANFNTFVGSRAGLSNATGGFNSFFGGNAGNSNNTGNSNSFFGYQAGLSNSGGSSNAFFGSQAGEQNTTQDQNTFIGDSAGSANGLNDPNKLANLNTFIGSAAGASNTTGGKNTIIGASANLAAGTLTNATAIGAKALVSQSNSLVLGSINSLNGATSDTNVGIGTTSPGYKLHIAGYTNHDWPIIKLQNVDSGGHSYWLYSGANGVVGDFGIYDETASSYRFYIRGSNGNVGIGTTNPQSTLAVNGEVQVSGNLGINGNFVFAPLPESNPACISPIFSGIVALGSCGSSLRFKSDVRTFNDGMSIVNRLRPISFAWKKDGRQDIGLAAEEVEMVEPLLTFRNEKGEVEGVRYNQLSAIFINAFKEQQSIIAQQRNRIEQQQSEIHGLKKLVCLDHPSAHICKREVKQ